MNQLRFPSLGDGEAASDWAAFASPFNHSLLSLTYDNTVNDRSKHVRHATLSKLSLPMAAHVLALAILCSHGRPSTLLCETRCTGLWKHVPADTSGYRLMDSDPIPGYLLQPIPNTVDHLRPCQTPAFI